MPHLIHLHGPWELSQADHDQRHYLFKRQFGRPTNLDPWERVLLVCQIDQPVVSITFNGVVVHGIGLRDVAVNDNDLQKIIPACDAISHDITARLQPRNELIIEVAKDLTRVYD